MIGSTMRAAVLRAPRRFEVAEVPVPKPGPRQVLVRIEGSGLCGSNLPLWQGRHPFEYPLPPGAPGHEGWGRIAAVGREVQGLEVGDRVAGLSSRAFADYDVFDARSTVVLPAALDDRDVPAEPLACAFNIFRRSDLRAGQTVAVVGVGFLGALLIRLAVNAGARVIAVSRRSYSREIGTRMGAEHVVASEAADAVDQVLALTGGEGCDRVLECAGVQVALDLATRLAKVRGRLVIAGLHQDGPRQIDLETWNWRGLDVVNAHEREPAIYVEGMRAALDAIASRALDPAPLYTHRVTLGGIGEAFRLLEDRDPGFVKGLVLA